MSELFRWRNAKHHHVIETNRFDREDLEQMLESLPAFSRANNSLRDFASTGGPAIDDAFFAFLKGIPTARPIEEMDPEYLINHRINSEMRDLPETERLRRFSIGDEVQSAWAVERIEPELETLFDRVEVERKQAEDLKRLLEQLTETHEEQRDVEEMIEAWTPDSESSLDELTEQQANLDSRAEELEAETEEALEQLQDALDHVADETRQVLRKNIANIAEEAEQFYNQALSWGLNQGEIQRLPADKRLELAKRLNTDRFRRIADLFGPMRNLMFTEQRRKVDYVPEELFDVSTGNDFSRVLPSELLILDQNEDEFTRRFAEGKLLQYELRGEEALSRGGIILCEDGSGSMSGEKEQWAKAVMLCLMHLARKQKRPFHLVHFGSVGQYSLTSFESPKDYTIDAILDAAELFFSGGTDFATPMTVALTILDEQHKKTGAVKSDVVFITDDECRVPASFMDDYLAESDRLQFTTYGFAIPNRGGHIRPDGALHQMCEGKVVEITDLLSGRDVSEVFGKL